MEHEIYNKSILLVDDEIELLNLLNISLKKEGFKHIFKAECGKKAIEIIQQEKIDLAILDVMLPDMDGYDICKYIRTRSEIPIIFLSAKGEEMDRIIGLAIGADDYVTKPFSIKEIVLRTKIRLQRMVDFQQNRIEKTSQPEKNDIIKVGPFMVDKMKMEITKNGIPIELKAKEYKMFLYMLENRNQIISKERFCEQVWGEDYFGFDNTIIVHIRRIREKIENAPSSPQYIITIKGLGYKLVIGEE